jgi:murein DD-endopeptidase MepM/ murein hydrolase activator NlpD
VPLTHVSPSQRTETCGGPAPGLREMLLATVSAATLVIALCGPSGTPALAQIPLPAGTDTLPETNRRILTAVCTNAGKAASISATMSDQFDREAFRKLENATAPSGLSGRYEQTISPEFIAVGDGQFRDASTAMVVIPGSKGNQSLFRIPLGKYDSSLPLVTADSQPLPGDVVHFRSKSGRSQFFGIIYGDGNPSRTPKVKSTLLIFNYTGLLQAAEHKKFNSLELNSFPPRITDKLLRAAYPELYGSRLKSGLRKLLFERNNGYAEARLGNRLLKGVYAGYYMRSQLWVNKDLEYRVLRRNYCPPLRDMSTLQSPGSSGWKGGVIGTQRTEGTKFHAGWDLHASRNTPVYATCRGVATKHVQWGEDKKGKPKIVGWGVYVKLQQTRDKGTDVPLPSKDNVHGKLEFLYAHLDSVAPAVEEGRLVMPGELIGYTGITGNGDADRPHLHLEMKEDQRGLVDPAQWIIRPRMVIEVLGSRPTPIRDWPTDPGVDWYIDPKSKKLIFEGVE